MAGSSPAFNQTQTVVIKGLRYAVIAGSPTAQDGDQYFTKLTLPAVSASQEGVYVCMAANDNGYVGREAFLQVATGADSGIGGGVSGRSQDSGGKHNRWYVVIVKFGS